jgi:hypothetical protein
MRLSFTARRAFNRAHIWTKEVVWGERTVREREKSILLVERYSPPCDPHHVFTPFFMGNERRP